MALTLASINVQPGEDGHADVALFQMAKSMLGAPLVIISQLKISKQLSRNYIGRFLYRLYRLGLYVYTYFCHYYGSIIEKHKIHLAFLLECCGVMVKNFNKKGYVRLENRKIGYMG